MCGIAVAIGWTNAAECVRTMLAGVAHRGEVTDPLVSPRADVALGTRRLPIVDPAHGRQPMLSADGRVLVAFNGEIYNHRALRRELEATGLRLHTDCDSEVLATALSVWGAGAVQRLVGMFAFVALDLSTMGFLAARDALGVKPLYLIQSGEGVLFCSEIAPLLSATPAGDVMLLPPGHVMTAKALLSYPTVFSQPVPPADPSPERLDAILRAAVHARVPEGRPVAVMFSGGLDSTLVAHYAREVAPAAPGYILGGADAPDRPAAQRYAELTGMDLRPVDLPQGDPLLWITRVVDTVETFEPNVVRGGLCTYALSQRIHADGFKVALCGDGADELFAGYPVMELCYAADPQIGEGVRNQNLALMGRDNLQLLDRCAMRFQIEAREPFLDPAVIAYALGCDRGLLFDARDGGLHGKAPLRRIFDLAPDRLPREIRDRPKRPFNEGCGFDRDARTGPWARYAAEALSDHDLKEGAAEYADYAVTTKEELLYLRLLAERMDVARVPHLKGRNFLETPRFDGDAALREYNLLDA